MESNARLSVVMPVYNEEKSIVEIINRVLKQPEVGELIAVNDGSTDKSFEAMQVFANNPKVKLLNQPKNCGKGAAIIRGFQEAKCDFVIIQDADFEYDPQDLPRVLQPILDGKADMVFGAREQFITQTGSHRGLFCGHYFINKFLTVFSNIFSGYGLNDMECCYKMFKKELFQKITLQEKRFGFEPEITLKTSRFKPAIAEVSVSYASRTYEEGKKINWKDGVSAVRCIIKYGLFRG